MEAAMGLVAALLLLIPGGLIFWALYRSTTLTQRLHPLTPRQRKAKRKAYAVLLALAAATVTVELVLGRAGFPVLVAVFGGVLLVDTLLTPWLHYRRASRQRRLR